MYAKCPRSSPGKCTHSTDCPTQRPPTHAQGDSLRLRGDVYAPGQTRQSGARCHQYHTDGAFVAVSIGYSFIPELTKHLTIEIPPLSSIPPILLTTGQGLDVRLTGAGLLPQALPDFNGFSRDFALFLLSSTQLDPNISPILNPIALMQSLLIQTCGLDFKYSIIDSGSGRELQNEPIHNIAGLGKADGERPFRPLAKPMLFMPRSTIRIEVEEVSEGLLYKDSLLYIVLHGYKILGYGTGLP